MVIYVIIRLIAKFKIYTWFNEPVEYLFIVIIMSMHKIVPAQKLDNRT